MGDYVREPPWVGARRTVGLDGNQGEAHSKNGALLECGGNDTALC